MNADGYIIVAAPGFYGDVTTVIATSRTRSAAIRRAKRECGEVFRAVAREDASGYRKGSVFCRVNERTIRWSVSLLRRAVARGRRGS